MVLTYSVGEIVPYINWLFFYHAWGVPPRSGEAVRLRREAESLLGTLEGRIQTRALFRLCQANSQGDDILIEGVRFAMLRQQTPHADGSPFLCLSDYIRPLSGGIPDQIGLFAASCEGTTEQLHREDPYLRMLTQTLSDRLAEATTEKLHEYVRRRAWGYAREEQLPVSELLKEKYQGIRPAVGYPSLPDQSIVFLLNGLLNMEQIGIRLTENGMMRPHASTCGLMMAHPRARYFLVGKIGEDQFQDYARRRGIPPQELRKYVAANLEG
ncbi:MAG: 5-methyltetrahydrofolate--homocysteine methyltransferase [Prevotellaceae bacterium]|jgi:cobalamin-dependent methionine synthase I|nr:5-methyltetrahydrofolate--homocysteine methyltransferase [Prevotellaceae bacterium]